jgi:hypothetical protein
MTWCKPDEASFLVSTSPVICLGAGDANMPRSAGLKFDEIE